MFGKGLSSSSQTELLIKYIQHNCNSYSKLFSYMLQTQWGQSSHDFFVCFKSLLSSSEWALSKFMHVSNIAATAGSAVGTDVLESYVECSWIVGTPGKFTCSSASILRSKKAKGSDSGK